VKTPEPGITSTHHDDSSLENSGFTTHQEAFKAFYRLGDDSNTYRQTADGQYHVPGGFRVLFTQKKEERKEREKEKRKKQESADSDEEGMTQAAKKRKTTKKRPNTTEEITVYVFCLSFCLLPLYCLLLLSFFFPLLPSFSLFFYLYLSLFYSHPPPSFSLSLSAY